MSTPLQPVDAPSFGRAGAGPGGGLFQALGRAAERSLPATADARIGKEGGTISVGGVTLEVPPGALDRTVRIQLTVPNGRFLEARFQPHGLQFEKPATLRFDLAGTDRRGGINPDDLIFVYLGNDAVPWHGRVPALETFPAVVRGSGVEAGIGHFSGYIVASGRSGPGGR